MPEVRPSKNNNIPLLLSLAILALSLAAGLRPAIRAQQSGRSGVAIPADQFSRERIGRETATYLERFFGATE